MIMNVLLDQAFLKKVSNVCLTYIFFLIYIYITYYFFVEREKCGNFSQVDHSFNIKVVSKQLGEST